MSEELKSGQELTQKDVYLEEYKSLRDEQIKRIELSSTILNLTFIAAGGLWAAAATFPDHKSHIIYIVYPLLSLSFAFAYVSNNVILNTIGHYIREVLEMDVPDLNWSTFFNGEHIHSSNSHRNSIYGIYVGGSLASLLLYISFAIYKPEFSPLWLVFGIVTTIYTFIYLRRELERAPADISRKMAEIDALKFVRRLIKEKGEIVDGMKIESEIKELSVFKKEILIKIIAKSPDKDVRLVEQEIKASLQTFKTEFEKKLDEFYETLHTKVLAPES
jgi:hypothetical protein